MSRPRSIFGNCWSAPKWPSRLLIERESGHDRRESGKVLGELWREKGRGANPAAGDVATVFGELAVLLQGDVVEDELGAVEGGRCHPPGIEGLGGRPRAGEAGRVRRGQRGRLPRLDIGHGEGEHGKDEGWQTELHRDRCGRQSGVKCG